MREVNAAHFRRYPAMEPQDAVKLVMQSVFGGGHMISDRAAALAYLREEAASVPQEEDAPLLEPIGGGLARLHLRGLRAAGLRAETVCGLFCWTADHSACSSERLAEGIALLRELASAGAAPFDAGALEAFLARWEALGKPSVHHSAAFREAYAPAYRLVPGWTEQLLPLLRAMDERLLRGEPVRVAIDGRCASGKSTLGERLREIYGAALFHMDDYYVPFARKTEERLRQPGGNADWERFLREVASVPTSRPVVWRRWDNRTDTFTAPRTEPPNPVRVTEGSYSQHPGLAGTADIRVALAVSPEEQRRRILARNGEEGWRMFRDRWIPLEEAYFAAVPVYAQSDFVLRLV